MGRIITGDNPELAATSLKLPDPCVVLLEFISQDRPKIRAQKRQNHIVHDPVCDHGDATHGWICDQASHHGLHPVH